MVNAPDGIERIVLISKLSSFVNHTDQNQDTWDKACVKLGKTNSLKKTMGTWDSRLKTGTVPGKLER